MLLFALLLAVRLVPGSPDVQYRQPQIAVSQNMVGLAFGADTTIYFSASRDQGRTFSKPVIVAEVPALALGRHRGPRIAITPEAIVISAAAHASGDLVAWRSTDGGRTWSAGIRVNDAPTSAREGLHAMVAGRDGLLYAAWLDHRLKGKRLYGASSRDGGENWSKNVLIYESPGGTICECCHPSLFVSRTGRVYAMWRNSLRGSRDMYVTSSTDGGNTFEPAQKLGEGTWVLNACPMDGGAFAVDADDKLTSIWRRESSIFLANPGESEVELAEGKDPALAIGNRGVYSAWSGPSGIQAMIPGEPQPVLLSADGAFVQLAGNDPVFAVWESNGAIVIESLSPDRRSTH